MSYRCAKPEAAICASAANAPFVRIADQHDLRTPPFFKRLPVASGAAFALDADPFFVNPVRAVNIDTMLLLTRPAIGARIVCLPFAFEQIPRQPLECLPVGRCGKIYARDVDHAARVFLCLC